MKKPVPCPRCGCKKIEVRDCGYSSFNTGHAKCTKCNFVVGSPCSEDEAAAKKYLTDLWNKKCALEWTQKPPTEQGTYWHWNGDTDSAPLPTFVMYSGTTGKCFVTMGQLGLTHAIDCKDYGGWWKLLPDPELPKLF